MTITQERSTKALFSTPYFNGGQVILTKTDNKDINTIDDLKNRKIGVQVDTVSEEQAKKITTANLVTTYASWENPEDKGKIIYDLKNGKTDAVIVDYIQAVDSVEKDAEVKIVGSPFTQEFYGAVTNLDNKTLMNAVDNVLRDIKKEGVLKNIEDKWTKS